jgi:hypothetical protein
MNKDEEDPRVLWRLATWPKRLSLQECSESQSRWWISKKTDDRNKGQSVELQEEPKVRLSPKEIYKNSGVHRSARVATSTASASHTEIAKPIVGAIR